MRRSTVATVAAAVAASLIAPSAILAEQPPGSQGGVTAPPLEVSQAAEGGSDPGAAEATDTAETDPAVAEPAVRTSVAPHSSRSAGTSAAPAASVVMQDFFFSPKTVTIDAGETVKWTNKGKAEEGHTATGDSFDSDVLHKGQTYTHKFPVVGTFDYICTLHSNMKGTVVVLAASGGGSSGDGGGSGQGEGGTGSSGADSSGSGSGGSDFGFGSGGGFSDSSGSGGSLPSTGEDLGLLALLGLDLLLAGTLVRLRSRAPGRG